MNIFQLISVQVLDKRIRWERRIKVATDMLTKGGGRGGQNFGQSAYVILERSLTHTLCSVNFHLSVLCLTKKGAIILSVSMKNISYRVLGIKVGVTSQTNKQANKQ